MRLFKLCLALGSGLVAWQLASHLSAQELRIVVAAGIMLAATALGVSVSAGTTLMLLLQKLKGSGLSPSALARLQNELWLTTMLFFPGLLIAIVCIVVELPWLVALVIIDSALLGLAYAHLVSSARLFYQFARS